MLLYFVVKPKNGFLRVFVSDFYLASFSVRHRNSVFRFKKSGTLTRVVWAEDSKTGFGIKIGPRQQKL